MYICINIYVYICILYTYCRKGELTAQQKRERERFEICAIMYTHRLIWFQFLFLA